MKSAQIRRLFLDFFVAQGHREVPSSSLVPADDPTLLFTNAGMVQFKRTFLGQEQRDYSRADDLPEVRPGGRQAQRSRAGGPHQAAPHLLRDAGQLLLRRLFQARRDPLRLGVRHQRAYLGISPDRLRVTVHHSDNEARGLWREITGLPDHRIYGLGDKDNFWQMGDTGPCGPCTEIYVDLEWARVAQSAPGRRGMARSFAQDRFRGARRGGPLPRDLESRLHAVRSLGRRHPTRCPSRRSTPARDSSGSRR